MIVAGEASGDLHGGDLAREIFALDPSCEMFGIAGERMRAQRVRALYRIEDIHGMGLTELAGSARTIVSAMRRLRAILRREQPDLLILIDYADFNLMLAGFARRAGVPVLYYIPPQVWAWRHGRIKKLIARADRLAVIFPFEQELYAKAGERVTLVGDPLLDKVHPAQGRGETLARHGFPPDARLLALLPGSRRAEVRLILPAMAAAARILARERGLIPVIALAPTLAARELAEQAKTDLSGMRIIEGDTYSIIAASQAALVASGTATRETALLGCPMVIVYKASPLTYWLGRKLVTGVKFIGMPNILAGEQIVPELIQGDLTPSNLVRAVTPMLDEPGRAQTVARLAALRSRLGAPGAAARVAAIALSMIA